MPETSREDGGASALTGRRAISHASTRANAADSFDVRACLVDATAPSLVTQQMGLMAVTAGVWGRLEWLSSGRIRAFREMVRDTLIAKGKGACPPSEGLTVTR